MKPIPPQVRATFALAVAVIALASSILMLRESRLPPGTLSFWRLLVAVGLLSPWFVKACRRHRNGVTPSLFSRCVVPGILLGLHFTTWVVGARSTEVANASLIVNMVPLVLPFILWPLIGEKVTTRDLLGTIIAFAGVAALTGADLSISTETAIGDLVCLGSMFFLAAYMAFGRKNGPQVPNVWLYVVPLYFVASIASLLIGIATGENISLPTGKELVLVSGLATGPTILGHALVNYALRHIRGQRVAVTTQCQFVFAGLFELALHGRWPPWGFYLAAPLVLAGAWIVLFARPGTGGDSSKKADRSICPR